MDEKFKRYKEYNFKDDEKWQMYLNNLYPMPPLKIFEKRKRKWYRENIDKEFDVNYDPAEEEKQNSGAQRRPNTGNYAGANPYAQAYHQAVHEEMPQLRPYVGIAYFLFIVTLPFAGITNKILLAA